MMMFSQREQVALKPANESVVFIDWSSIRHEGRN
jgi:hypothetical protein